jgi:hypothetical protein
VVVEAVSRTSEQTSFCPARSSDHKVPCHPTSVVASQCCPGLPSELKPQKDVFSEKHSLAFVGEALEPMAVVAVAEVPDASAFPAQPEVLLAVEVAALFVWTGKMKLCPSSLQGPEPKIFESYAWFIL